MQLQGQIKSPTEAMKQFDFVPVTTRLTPLPVHQHHILVSQLAPLPLVKAKKLVHSMLAYILSQIVAMAY